MAKTTTEETMKDHLTPLVRIISLITTVVMLAATAPAQGAPGDFLTDWGTQYSFNNPSAVATDSAGNAYVADTMNNRIQKFDSSGRLLTQWGSGGSDDGQFSMPGGVAVDDSGNVYVADTGNNRIEKFDANGRFLVKWGSYGPWSGQFSGPTAVAVHNGYVYIADSGNHRIQKWASNGDNLGIYWGEWFSAPGVIDHFGSDGPYSVAVDEDGYLYVPDYLNERVLKFTITADVLSIPNHPHILEEGGFILEWGGYGFGDGQFSHPQAVTADGSGNVYVTEHNNHRVQKFTTSGAFLTKWGTYGAGNGQFISPAGVAVYGSDSVYVADPNNHRIQKFDSSGGYLTQWESYGPGVTPNGVAVDRSGNVYVADTLNNRMQKFDSSGGYLTQWGGSLVSEWPGPLFYHPYGAAVDGSGNLYVADTDARRIQKFDSSGGYLTEWNIAFTGTGRYSLPYGVAVDSSGSIYVTDRGDSNIQKFDSNGRLLTAWGVLGSGNGELSGPYGIAVDGSDNVYVADSNNNRIQKFDSNGGYLSQWGSYGTGSGQFDAPAGVAVDAKGNIYVTDTNNNRVQVFGAGGQFIGQWGSSGNLHGQFSVPTGVAVDASGMRVYVADSGNKRIQVFAGYGAPTLVVSAPLTVTSGSPFAFTVTAVDGAGNTVTTYTGMVHFTSSDNAATLPADVMLTSGVGTFTATMGTEGSQSITATDKVDGTIFGTSNAISVVAALPDLTLTKTHSGDFHRRQQGATYSITATNSGTATTTGTVTVTDTLPTGLNATGIAGAGWTCVQPAGPCTRSDVLSAGASYPSLTLSVNVARDAPASVTNTASISGGGEKNLANNTASDPTGILPDLVVTMSHAGNFSTGQVGATYSITAANLGPGATTGAVRVSFVVPTGLTATGITGTGWTCTQPRGPCTRSDILAANATYPVLTATVNVSYDSPASVTSSASVAGGGEVNTSNDTASDITFVTLVSPDLMITKSHVGEFRQGGSGTYTITVSNIGTGPTRVMASNRNAVTVTDTPPASFRITGISGSGWSCQAPRLRNPNRNGICTTAQTLSPGSSYPVITVTVRVGSDAPTEVTNTAAVSGGGDANTSNNTVTDVTAILQQPIP
jgi:tripartite motif-containing protein 71